MFSISVSTQYLAALQLIHNRHTTRLYVVDAAAHAFLSFPSASLLSPKASFTQG